MNLRLRTACPYCAPDELCAVHVVDVLAAGWDETKHPRNPAGHREGGRFTDRAGAPETVPTVYLADSQSEYGGYIQKPGVFLRFGDVPVEGGDPLPSMNHLSGVREKGLSVYPAWHDPTTGLYVIPSGSEQYLATQMEIQDRPVYRVRGVDTKESGDDGEPLLDPSSVTIEEKVPHSQIVTEGTPYLTLAGDELDRADEPDWHAITAAASPPAHEFQAAVDQAFGHVEMLEPDLAEQYAVTLRKAGRRAARQFRMSSVLQPQLVAAGDVPTPGWTVPPVDELVDTVQVAADLLANTAETRQAAAVSATRPIMSAMGVSFSLESPMVADLVSRSGVRAAKISIPGLRDAVISAMTEAFAEGLSVPDTAALIEQQVDGLADYQSTMLARTDLIGTANGGSLLAAKVVYPQGTIVKRWVNATDSNVETDGRIRDTHLEANGQTVPLDGYFHVGGDRLLYPGDPSGADEEVINCRCVVVYEDSPRSLNAAAVEIVHGSESDLLGRDGVSASPISMWADGHRESEVCLRALGDQVGTDESYRLAGLEGGHLPSVDRSPTRVARGFSLIDDSNSRSLMAEGNQAKVSVNHEEANLVGESSLLPNPGNDDRSFSVDQASDVGGRFRRHTPEYIHDRDDLNAAAWDETKHPRFHSGVREGGRFKTAAERAREAKAMRDSVEMDEPPNLERRDRVPSETISEVDRAKARRALSYTSDDGLLLRVRDASSWDDLSGEDRMSLARYLEDVQDETDHENLQPLIDRLKTGGKSNSLPPRGSYPVTATGLPAVPVANVYSKTMTDTAWADQNDWGVTATGWEGGNELTVFDGAPEPDLSEVVAAMDELESSHSPSIGAIIDAVAGGIGRQISDLTQALTALSSRPIEMTVPPELTAAVQNPPQVIVNVPEQLAPIVNVTVPESPPAQITVQVPEQAPPVVNVAASEAPVVNVSVPTPSVQVVVEKEEREEKRVTFQRDASGRIMSAEIVEEPENG